MQWPLNQQQQQYRQCCWFCSWCFSHHSVNSSPEIQFQCKGIEWPANCDPTTTWQNTVDQQTKVGSDKAKDNNKGAFIDHLLTEPSSRAWLLIFTWNPQTSRQQPLINKTSGQWCVSIKHVSSMNESTEQKEEHKWKQRIEKASKEFNASESWNNSSTEQLFSSSSSFTFPENTIWSSETEHHKYVGSALWKVYHKIKLWLWTEAILIGPTMPVRFRKSFLWTCKLKYQPWKHDKGMQQKCILLGLNKVLRKSETREVNLGLQTIATKWCVTTTFCQFHGSLPSPQEIELNYSPSNTLKITRHVSG